MQGLARPGGNVIGVSNNIGDDDQWDKRIQLLKEMVLQATRFGWVETRVLRDQYDAAELEQCRQLGLTRVGPPLNHPIDETEYRRLFAALAQEGAEEILLTDDPENVTNFRLIIELAEKGRLVSGRLFSISVFCTRRPGSRTGRDRFVDGGAVRTRRHAVGADWALSWRTPSPMTSRPIGSGNTRYAAGVTPVTPEH